MTRALGRSKRLGAVLAVALTMLLVVGLMLGVLLERSVREQRQSRVQQFEWQAQWLARAGLERARAERARKPDYDGETWRPQLGDRQAEVVLFLEEAQGDDPAISVVVTYPAGDPRGARFACTQPLTRP